MKSEITLLRNLLTQLERKEAAISNDVCTSKVSDDELSQTDEDLEYWAI